jgi:hypothetical protein
MDDYDGIYNFNGLKYNPSKIFDSLFFFRIKIYGKKELQ